MDVDSAAKDPVRKIIAGRDAPKHQIYGFWVGHDWLMLAIDAIHPRRVIYLAPSKDLHQKDHFMSTNLTKREIVLEIYRKAGFPQKQIVDTVQQTLDIVQKALSEGRNVELRNFGVLEVQVRKQRVGRNPNKPEAEVIIPQRAVVKFKAGKILKQQLKKLDLTTLL
jgi:nucleoid DNA-binding protein